MWQANRANKLPENLRIIMLSMWVWNAAGQHVDRNRKSADANFIRFLVILDARFHRGSITSLPSLSSNESLYRRVR